MSRKTIEEKDLEYLKKMYRYITEDLKTGRDISSIMWSICRHSDWWRNKLLELQKEFWPKPREKTPEEIKADLVHKEFMENVDLKLHYMIKNRISPFDDLPMDELISKPLW